MKRKFVVLKPQYMNEFECIGAACSDTCCAGWRVDIDKKTYKNYRKIKDKELSEKVTTFVKKNKDGSNDERYGFIQTGDGACGFLNNGLCDIQLKLGEDYLSKTCLSYPRVFNFVDNQVELSAKLSCPEIARLVLLNERPMEFDVVEELLDPRQNHTIGLKTNDNAWNSCFWEIRTFAIDLLQNRNYSISERMILLGMFCEKLSSVPDNSGNSMILDIINNFKMRVTSVDTKEQLSTLPMITHVQIKLLKEMVLSRKSNHERFNEYSRQTNAAFHIGTTDQQLIEDSFTDGYNKYYKPFIEQHPYIFENYLVNQFFERLFLSRGSFKVLNDYVLLVILYSILRFHIQGVATYTKEMTAEKAVSIIQACSKVIEHDQPFLKSLRNHIKNSEFDTWALLTVLVKE
ncbi:flagellin lysine-N-methylase [Paenibacillus lautus]|uniref:flagellin lysine-N-methylase n=1 Tax=Paenibacillus lautus TaxID=1401 RepID=UPI0039865513